MIRVIVAPNDLSPVLTLGPNFSGSIWNFLLITMNILDKKFEPEGYFRTFIRNENFFDFSGQDGYQTAPFGPLMIVNMIPWDRLVAKKVSLWCLLGGKKASLESKTYVEYQYENWPETRKNSKLIGMK